MKKRLQPKIKPNWKHGDKINRYGIYGWFHGEGEDPWFDILGGQLKTKDHNPFYYTIDWVGSNYFKPAAEIPSNLKYTKRGLAYK